MGMGPLMSLLVILLLSAYAAPECLVPVAVLVLLFSAAFFCLELEKFNLRKLLRVLCSDAETGYLLLLLFFLLLELVDFCPLALFFFFS